ncbi:hypothetical protein [Thioalkalivibrio sp. XN8]|uniref:hypothetical protein n=1 Tax=Thioalkalivibrio sp. XN8 TaxID=2712863 RepID=UPI0013EB2D02|nr:hypothetical protein [Thioalkalivibrio sp. XN8]NGP53706.1 hypothetical protein [Thioalkalivibrio sp. XN8]
MFPSVVYQSLSSFAPIFPYGTVRRALAAFFASLALFFSAGSFAQAPPNPPTLIAIDDSEFEAIHDFTGLPIDQFGWTDFGALTASGYDDARVVFVSNEGSDNLGKVYGIGDLTFDDKGMFQPRVQVSAFATIAAANAQMREGYPDILLLRRGDEWSESFTSSSAGRPKSGRSASERQIIASYGAGDRPRLFQGSIDAYSKSYLIVTGLHIYNADWTTAGRALDVNGFPEHQLYEDIRFDRNSKDLIQGGDIRNVAIRRCFYSHYQAHDGFVFVSKTNGMLFEENVFYEPYQKNYPDGSRFGRHLYLSPTVEVGGAQDGLKNLILRRNVFFRGEREAADFRAGGLIEDNLFLQNDITMVGGRGGSIDSVQSATIINNVFMQGPPNINSSNILHLINMDGTIVKGNIWTDPRGISAANVITITGVSNTYILRNTSILENVVYNYVESPGGVARAVSLSNDFTEVRNVSIQDNEFQFGTGSAEIIMHRDWTGGAGDRFSGFSYRGNKYYSGDTSDIFMPGDNFAGWQSASGETEAEFTRISYPDPQRTIDSYLSGLGLSGGAEEFAAQALSMSRSNWNPSFTAGAVNDYIRAGFGR